MPIESGNYFRKACHESLNQYQVYPRRLTMESVQHTFDAAASAVASKVTGVGSGVTLVSWMTANEIGIWVGILIGLAGLFVNWYFKHKSDKRQTKAHEAYLARLENFALHGADVPAPFDDLKDSDV